jgi:FkbM family methyltransferase
MTANLITRCLRLAKPLVERTFPRLSTVYRATRDSLSTLDAPPMTKLGFHFKGSAAMQDGSFEPAEVELVKKHLEAADVFVNIGANVGFYVCIALDAGKHAIAFEPIESNVRQLYRNVWANGWQDNVEVFPLALGEASGLIEIFGGGTGASLVKGWANVSEAYRRIVPISTLDAVLGDRLAGKKCLFVVDIEGAEKSMLSGAIRHIRMHPRPVWLVEITAYENQPEGTRVNPHLLETFEMFWREGYRSWTADRRAVEITAADIRRIMANPSDGSGTYNYLFVHA